MQGEPRFVRVVINDSSPHTLILPFPLPKQFLRAFYICPNGFCLKFCRSDVTEPTPLPPTRLYNVMLHQHQFYNIGKGVKNCLSLFAPKEEHVALINVFLQDVWKEQMNEYRYNYWWYNYIPHSTLIKKGLSLTVNSRCGDVAEILKN